MSAPRWAEALIRWSAPSDRVDDLLGDLEEVHGRRARRHGPLVAGLGTGAEACRIALALLAHRRPRVGPRDLFTGTELRLALRLIGRHPFLSFTSVLALAVGITIATAGFTVLNSLLNPSVPIDTADRLVELRLLDARTGTGADPTPEAYARWQESADGLVHLSAVRHGKMNVRYPEGDVELVDGAMITPGTFDHLPYVPVVGRRLTQADARPGAEPVVLLRESLWQRQFGGADDVLGERLEVNGTGHRVVGVLPDTTTFPTAPDLWLPLDTAALRDPAEVRDLSLHGVLAPDVRPDMMETELTALLADLPTSADHADGLVADVRGVGELDAAALPGGLMVAVLAALLMVVASNVGNLVVARNAARHAELAIRSALGAGRRRIVAQLTLEVLVMVALAAVLGLVASDFLLTSLGSGETEDLPPWVDFTLNVRIAGFVVALAGLATLFAGLLPAIQITRRDLGFTLNAGPHAGLGRAFGRRNDVAIVVQIALSVAILGAASMIHLGWAGQYARRLPDVPLDRVLTARITLAGHPEAPAVGQLDADVERARRAAITAALKEIPGVLRVSAGTHIPGTDAPRLPLLTEWEDANGAEPRRLAVAWIGPDYLDTLEIEPVAGRGFAPADLLPDALPVALVNQPFVDERLGGRNPLGLRLRQVSAGDDAAPVWHEIVGVVPDLGMSAADPDSNAGVYLPLQARPGFWVFVGTTAPPATLAASVQRQAYRAVPDAAVDAAMLLAERIAVRQRVFLAIGSVTSSLGAMVMLLSLTAIYAILSFEVTRRMREFGIRAALGARGAQIASPVVRRVATYVATGGVLGSILGTGLVGLARGLFVMRFPPTGVWLFAAVVALTTVAAVAASWFPVYRAIRVDPMQSLRAD